MTTDELATAQPGAILCHIATGTRMELVGSVSPSIALARFLNDEEQRTHRVPAAGLHLLKEKQASHDSR